MTKKTKNKYSHYTEDFRREAVRRVDLPGASAVEVARELGIHPGQIYNRRRQYKRLSDKQFNTVNGVDYSQEEAKRSASSSARSLISKKRTNSYKRPLRTSAKKSGEVRLHPFSNGRIFDSEDVRWLGVSQEHLTISNKVGIHNGSAKPLAPCWPYAITDQLRAIGARRIDIAPVMEI